MIREIFGKKIGMTQIFDGEDSLTGVTVVEIEPACVLEKITYPTKEKAKIGCFKVAQEKVKKIKKPLLGYFKKLGVSPYRMVKEVELAYSQEFTPKKEVGVEIFEEGEIVDVQGKTKGRGFQGGMKRYGWRGQPRSHGSMTHRRIGSAGASTYPGRIVKGHRMPGHMGNVKRTVKNLRVVKVDKERRMIFLAGSVPGSVGSILLIRKSGKCQN